MLKEGLQGMATPNGPGTASKRRAELKMAHKWPGGYMILAALGVPTILERRAESEEAHKWARWLRTPCRLGDPHRFRAGGTMTSGPHVGPVAKSTMPPWGSQLQSGG